MKVSLREGRNSHARVIHEKDSLIAANCQEIIIDEITPSIRSISLPSQAAEYLARVPAVAMFLNSVSQQVIVREISQKFCPNISDHYLRGGCSFGSSL